MLFLSDNSMDWTWNPCSCTVAVFTATAQKGQPPQESVFGVQISSNSHNLLPFPDVDTVETSYVLYYHKARECVGYCTCWREAEL